MKTALTRVLLMSLVCMFVMGWAFDEPRAQCGFVHPPSDDFCRPSNPTSDYPCYRTYYHNSGRYARCDPDFDIDLPEFFAFVDQNPIPLYRSGKPVIGDYFDGSCPTTDLTKHGWLVKAYFDVSETPTRKPWAMVERTDYSEKPDENGWADMVEDIASTYGNFGTVANLSLGWRWYSSSVTAIIDAFNSGVLLSCPGSIFDSTHSDIYLFGDKVLLSIPVDAQGAVVMTETDLSKFLKTNVAAVCASTNWTDGDCPRIAGPDGDEINTEVDSYPGEGRTGSLTSGLLSGCVQYVADVVYDRGLRNAAFTEAVIDYVVSSCDRKIGTFERLEGQSLTSYGPWSETRGYGTFSAWKALIYAYGYGKLEAQDTLLDPGIVLANPPTTFSDHFYLRGDLYVPAGQTFEVNSLATVSVDADITPGTQEGPELGVLPNHPEIHVCGVMTVETSLETEQTVPKNGVNATVTVGSGGTCTVVDGGTITISAGQRLDVALGGTLNLNTGGEIIVEAGGMLIVLGQFNHSGTLTLESGSTAIFGPTATVHLASNLDVPAGATFMGSYGSETTVTPGVEITCSGTMNLMGASSDKVVLHGEPGQGNWAGIRLLSDGTTSNYLNFVEISGADIGIDVGGTAPATLWNLTVTDCGSGVKVAGRSDVALSATVVGEIANCTNGVELDLASISVNGMSIHGNDTGIRCTQSSPTVRNCEIYDNAVGVLTLDSGSLPDLGTISDPGDNDFYGPDPYYPGLANDLHITATDPADDIYAQFNWWGTTKESNIRARIMVIDAPPQGCGDVVVDPLLTGGPQTVSPPETDPGPKEQSDEVAETTYLGQNHPNPFNPTTTIRFWLGKDSKVTLRVFDVAGRLVRELANEQLGAGQHERFWDGTDSNGNAVATGIYFYRLTAGQFTETKKMILLK